MTEGKEGKFCRVDQHLRIAVGLNVLNVSMTKPDMMDIPDAPGVVEVRSNPQKEEVKVYLKLGHDDVAPGYPIRIQARVPEILNKAPWGEILFNNNKVGARALFCREGEEMTFGPEPGKYVILRLYREKEQPFNPVFVRVDKGARTYFFVLKARWEGEVITIDIERDPSNVPQFFQ